MAPFGGRWESLTASTPRACIAALPPLNGAIETSRSGSARVQQQTRQRPSKPSRILAGSGASKSAGTRRRQPAMLPSTRRGLEAWQPGGASLPARIVTISWPAAASTRGGNCAAAPLAVVLGLARLTAEFPFDRGQQGRQLVDHRR
ncbi:hypothetical protein, partial [Klebsiella pneumoniae]|uniref:hypothetical protein n=1 Tax=Klebsiella pneumoniae TaxID=573 RepID=UPI001A930713